MPLIERACLVLMLDARERLDALMLAVPEMSSALLASRHSAILDASMDLRRTVRRLWSASSVVEALQIAAEESTTHFDDASLVFFVQRVAPGRWAHPFVIDRGIGATTEEMYQEIALNLSPEGFDEFVLHQLLTAPGDVGTRDSFNLTCVAGVYEAALEKYRLGRAHFIHSRIRSRGGIVAGITVKHEREHAYTDVERATISAIASVASLAIS